MAKATKPRFKSAKVLLRKLGAERPGTLNFTGMIKPTPEDDTSILFAQTGDCSQWIPLPVERIEDIELVRWVHCGDDRFPQVRITMKVPKGRGAGVFSDLAMLRHTQVSSVGPPGPSSCYFDWKLNRIVCP